MLGNYPPIKFPHDATPQLIVVVDTEEEFDWSAEPDRSANTVRHMESIHLVQDIFDEYNIVPCYVIDYPIASQASSIEVLRDFHHSGRCVIGAHLHPWVNPPFDEQLSRPNMFPSNLSVDIEYEKLKALTGEIESSFGDRPRVYKAGRYGVGDDTVQIMHKLGYDIDVSICTGFDYRVDGGPDFSHFSADPYWFGPDNNMLEIPLSGGFAGVAGALSIPLYNLAGHFNFIKARGILSRLGIVDRLMLSPEGYSSAEHKKLTEYLYNQGVRTFTWNFHSPTVVPGMTMYTRTNADVKVFLDSFRHYFDYFFGKLGGVATTPIQLKDQLENKQ